MKTPKSPQVRQVRVGPFTVVDGGPEDVVQDLVSRIGEQQTAFALHVGGLNHSSDAAFVAAMASASTVYADGISVTLLAKLAGARNIRRAATTDLGWLLFEAFARALGRRCRVALLGGPPGLADAAGHAMASSAPVEVVLTEDGYQKSYSAFLKALADRQPDIIVVGLGMPTEAKWVNEHKAELPESLILTCGGWLGFVAGKESRAPGWAQRHGLEWAHRLIQDPRRLWKRYAVGISTVTRMVFSQYATRSSRSC